MTIDPIRAKALGDIPHGFLGRRGGVSTNAYASLNVGIGSDDDPANIAENRRRATEAVLPGAKLVGLYQVHSADAVTVIEPFDDAIRPHADALVTNRPGLALGILTADCAPVLFADREAGVVGAAHAGWKGALGGVTDSTILAMEAIGAHRDRIVAAVVTLAANLGLRSIAEGVETPEQLALLRETGCDQAQGYLFARPMALADVPGLIDRPWGARFGVGPD